MKVFLIKNHYNDIRTYHKGYKGPFSYFKKDLDNLIKYYKIREKQYPGKVEEIKKDMKIEVYMADENTPLTKIAEYPV